MLRQTSAPDIRPDIRFASVREASVKLAQPLSAEDCCAQSMPDASPVKWHLAHTTWFFETFVLEPFESRFAPFDPAFRVLFNSYYNGVGARHPRPERGLLTRPDLQTVLNYREHVDERMNRLFAQGVGEELLAIVELGLQHEQQHQELLLTDVKHLLSRNPLWPAYRESTERRANEGNHAPAHARWHAHAGGLLQIGHEGHGFAFDNERPRHSVFLQPFEIAEQLVTNAQYLEFIEDGGYRDPALWLAEGWDWRAAQALEAPLYWRRSDADASQSSQWQEFSLEGPQALAPRQPVVHLSYFEADAFARWAGARLPTEAEWEAVAQATASRTAGAHFAESGALHPVPEEGGKLQMFGNVWQWTRSSYEAYPGFQPAEGAVGEYNGKFMVNQYVLRGGSCATPQSHIRASYRNFFPATARWQFAGLRLARG
ncbi:ergothioneine biosynthesis protein EgtB [Diaphorobacter aerolatus]|uniref:Ergothioneine biosynthesis protein EgtB n=1 Tax=Diaphorobacter aerolatus TaxID=1288495 RepID=A0A7H0GKD0_9BURK|nr:ergothioneine biosynthesis protein EgtB [Diaphorobacter aerolatus]QNP48746.1 ergothioneine biosynthesis protein EgtB [Diaphorobacter aerolatus]